MLAFLPALTKNLASANRREAEGRDGKKVTVRTADLTAALALLGLLMAENERMKGAVAYAERRARVAAEAARLAYWPAIPRIGWACVVILCAASVAAVLFLRAHVH